MDKKDIVNLSNIYQNILIEAKNDQILDEGISGGYLQGLQAAQAGKLNPLASPSKKENIKDYLNLKNKPTVGNKVIKKGDSKIVGIVRTPIDRNGQYEILLLSPYVYRKTKNYPSGGIFNKNKPLGKNDAITEEKDKITVGYDTQFPYWQDYKKEFKRGLKNF